jgi:4-alpha-glucanotransferase
VSDELHFLFGVHNHQPVGNFDSVVTEAVIRAYQPFLEVVRDASHFPLTVHCSGRLLVFMRDTARPAFDLLGSLVSAGRIELLTGGFYEPILAMIPDRDKVGQIQALTEFLKSHFGVSPRGMWLAERVWEPQLPKALREAGVEFVLLDESHFGQAGLVPETLGGYYLTEEQGATLAVFPIDQRLRYLIPFSDPEESLRYLESRRGAGAVTMVDDGEKFGLWPGTDRLVYGERWLRRFFDTIEATPWLRPSTLSRYLETNRPTGRIYLPTASYTEMGEWALPAAASAELLDRKKQLAGTTEGLRVARLLKGGFWRNFLVKYPEVADSYWKQLRLSARVGEALAVRPGDPRLLAAREQLWQGQANDAYWHGVFGGCYLPHLRRAVKAALIACERLLEPDGDAAGATWQDADIHGDGRVEVAARTPEWSLVLNPERGGTVSELCSMSRAVDLADVLTRRPEGYHAQVTDRAPTPGEGAVQTIHGAATAREEGLPSLLQYDAFRRVSLLDALFHAEGPLDALAPWAAARAVAVGCLMNRRVVDSPETVEIVCTLERLAPLPLAIEKSVTVPRHGAWLDVRYRLRWHGDERLTARWGVQLNLALSAGDAMGRYFRLPDRPSLGSRGHLDDQPGVTMVDEWLGCEVGLEWTPRAAVGWAPVETVSLSESGFERIYQGTALLVTWPIEIVPGAVWEATLRLALSVRSASGSG